jgi:V/A-type H+-transporting ATPase subunit D
VAKLKLSKSSLQQQRAQLALYRKILPSLDLKRRQIMVEHQKALAEHERALSAVEALERGAGAELPMLAATDIDLKGLVRIRKVEVAEENIAGVKVPRLEAVAFKTARYSYLARPSWVDHLAAKLREAAEQRIKVRVSEKRAAILAEAVRRLTQRVNLFEQVLIPTARHNIRRIQVYLGDLEREAVIRSKLSKSMHWERTEVGRA